jgi:hypothetical protein
MKVHPVSGVRRWGAGSSLLVVSNQPGKGPVMSASGELIRMMNYVDDIAATLRRVNASLYLLSTEEKRRLAEYMRKSEPNFLGMVELLEREE